MEGLNVRVNVIARPQGADDTVGGSVRTDTVRYSDVRARISNMALPSVLAQQGVQGEDLHKIILYPDDYPDVEREDIVVPTRGRWNGARFRVTEVRPSSVLDGRGRAHVQLTCSRIRYANENVPEV